MSEPAFGSDEHLREIDRKNRERLGLPPRDIGATSSTGGLRRVEGPVQREIDFERSVATPFDRCKSLIVMKLVDWLRREATAQLNQIDLAAHLGCSRAGIQKALSYAAQNGWVRAVSTGPHTPRVYRLTDALRAELTTHDRSRSVVENSIDSRLPQLAPEANSSEPQTPTPVGPLLASIKSQIDNKMRPRYDDRNARARDGWSQNCATKPSAYAAAPDSSKRAAAPAEREIASLAKQLQQAGVDIGQSYKIARGYTWGTILDVLRERRAAADAQAKRGQVVRNMGGWITQGFKRVVPDRPKPSIRATTPEPGVPPAAAGAE